MHRTMVVREGVLSRLRAGLGSPSILKVVAGLGKSGASTALLQFADDLRAGGFPAEDVVLVDLLGPGMEGVTSREALDAAVSAACGGRRPRVLIVDGIHRVDGWDRFAAAVCSGGCTDLYVSGSGGHMLSADIHTALHACTMEIWVLPLSFAEYAALHRRIGDRDELFRLYAAYGGMPVAYPEAGGMFVGIMLEGLVNTIMMNNISARQMTPNSTTAAKVATHLFSAIGTSASISSVSKATGISQNTVEKYVSTLIDVGAFHYAPRYDADGGRVLKTNGRYYAADLGLRGAMIGRRASPDETCAMENLVYLELLRRGCSVYVANRKDRDVGFAAMRNGSVEYVCAEDGEGLLPKGCARTVLTRGATEPGTDRVNLLDWLLGPGPEPRVTDAPDEWLRT